MLEARKPSVWKSHYEISADRRVLTEWHPSTWRTGGKFSLAGRHYEVRANMWTTKFQLTTEDGILVAAANRVTGKHWTVEAGGVTYTFQRTSMFRQEQALMAGDRQVGLIKRTKQWRGDATADLPGLPQPVAVFVFAVVLSTWDAASAAASG